MTDNKFLGAHQSIAGGIYNAIEAAYDIGTDTVQIFTKNSNRWVGKNISQEDINKFFKYKEEYKIKQIVAHASYLINLSSSDNDLLEKSKKCWTEDIDNCIKLKIKYLVLHPGSHKGKGEEKGIKNISKALNEIFESYKNYDFQILLETTAGQGNSIGHKIEHLKNIFSLIKYKEKIAFCLDTCHLFAAGYDFRDKINYNKFKEKLKILDLSLIKAIHLNDSKKDLGSRIDRHEHIGKGKIGIKAFSFFLNDKDFIDIPFIIETPKADNMDKKNIEILKSLIK